MENIDLDTFESNSDSPQIMVKTKASWTSRMSHPNWRSDYFTFQIDSDRPYKCNDCLKSYVTKTSLNRHFFAAHCQGYQCPKCLFCFSDMKSLVNHPPSLCTGASQNIRKYNVECILTNKKQLRDYNREKSDKVRRNHPNWRSDFYTINKDREQPFKCNDCDKSFSRKKYITQHFYAIHCKGYQCPKCQFCFASNQALRKHRSDISTKRNMYTKSKNTYQSHPKWRSDFYTLRKDKHHPYQCTECSKKITNCKSVGHHFYAFHCQGYQCQRCEKCFLSNDLMKKHQVENCTGRNSDDDLNTNQQNVNQPTNSDFAGYKFKQEIVEIEDESELPYLTKIHNTTGLEDNTVTDVESMFQSSSPKLLEWNPDSDLTCMPCGKIFPHVNDLNKHLNQYQDGNCHKEKQTCPVCNYILDNIYLLQAHLEQIHHGKVINPEKEI